MPLHLVGETIDKARSHYRAETGKLVQLMRGIYVDADDDINAVVARHAIRIARYLYPNAYLSGASAVLLAPTADGRLFISGRRRQRTRIRSLEIIQNEAPKRPSVASVVIDDGMGEFRVDVSSLRQRFLEAFRLRSEHATSIDDGMRDGIASRLIEEYGTSRAAADAVWAFARENDWYREGERAERYLLREPTRHPVRNQAALDLIVAWHGIPIGDLSHDGFEWRWVPRDAGMPPLIRQTTPGKLPPFIVSLLPEGWLQSVLQQKDERAALRAGKRYMSNITIGESEAELSALPQDVLTTTLDRHTKEGVFTGRYAGPTRGEIGESFEHKLARLFKEGTTPRLSGVQIKAPMYLDERGILAPSTEAPFTHILKPAGTSGFETLPIVEWIALTLARTSGFSVPSAALVEMPDGMQPALVVERFDIRQGPDDRRMLALEDFCSVLDLPTEAKYDGTMERVARSLRALSTAPDQDEQTLLRRALFAWLIADGDMHLKNMAVLKIAELGANAFSSVNIAPVYDVLTTRVFPGLKHDRMALKLNGKDNRLRRPDFQRFARTAGMTASMADEVIDALPSALRTALATLLLPRLITDSKSAAKTAHDVLTLVRLQLDAFE